MINLIIGGSVFVLLFALFLVFRILKENEGTEEMKKVAFAVREGANTYLKRQYRGVALFSLFLFIILIFLVKANFLPLFSPYAFLSGVFLSALSGFIGMSVATRSSSRTTEAARSSLNKALRVAFSSGMVMGLSVVGFAILNISFWFIFLRHYYLLHPLENSLREIASTLFCAGMGASTQALFARVGGGIFTKGADVGADLVGKVEAGIPEDDPRNPAVIADNVGDNVGDIAGMGGDLYESYLDAIIAAMALSLGTGLALSGFILPLVIAAGGAISAVIGSFLVHSKEKAEQRELLSAIRRGTYGAGILVAIISFFSVQYLIGSLGYFWAIIAGLLAGNMIGFFTEYFTSDNYSPTRNVAISSETGPATVILEGFSSGMFSTFLPVLTIALATLASYYLAGGLHNPSYGLYGVALSAVGMLSTLGITLATDSYGPVADNAGGNAEMTKQPSFVRERTDSLDSLGNTTAATGKGFAIGSAALTALALIAVYYNQITRLGGSLDISLMNPRLIVGLFIGAMFPFLFASMAIKAVGRTAQKIVLEVRRQFREIVGLMEGKAEPDYSKAIDICTQSAQREMILPSLITIFSPLVIGFLLGAEAVLGLLTGALVSGFAMAVMMANSGATWDNAKKYIERGNLGGKGSERHKATVIGDTVGDPFKDTAGPSLNILIKLMSIVSIVFASFIIRFTLF